MAKERDRKAPGPRHDDAEEQETGENGAADAARARDPNEGDPLHPNPPYTVTKRMTAPKFGSAGSGGAENEPGPERD